MGVFSVLAALAAGIIMTAHAKIIYAGINEVPFCPTFKVTAYLCTSQSGGEVTLFNSWGKCVGL
jgi:hypothetical protein